MIILLLLLILVAILYSTERGRELLTDFAMLPINLILYPFIASNERKEKARIKMEKKAQTDFKQSLSTEVLTLIKEEFLLKERLLDIYGQISLYKKFENGEADIIYLKDENSILHMIKPEEIQKLKNKK